MMYDSDIVTGRSRTVQDDFEVVRGAAIEVDMALG